MTAEPVRNAYSDAYRDVMVAADSLTAVLGHGRVNTEQWELQLSVEQHIPMLVETLHDIASMLLGLYTGEPDGEQ